MTCFFYRPTFIIFNYRGPKSSLSSKSKDVQPFFKQYVINIVCFDITVLCVRTTAHIKPSLKKAIINKSQGMN